MIDIRHLSFVWPLMLWFMLLVPLLAWSYLRLLKRRREAARRYASLELLGVGQSALMQAAREAGMAAPSRWKRLREHVPAMLLLLAVAAMLLALARPQAPLLIPSRVESVILAMDISGSMRATDVKPDRITAAQNAAKAFIAGQPGAVRVGVVSIAGAAALVQSPTRNRQDLYDAIDRFQLQRGTALGSGLILSLATLLPEADIDVELFINGHSSRARPSAAALPGAGQPAAPEQKPAEVKKAAEPGSNNSAAIVLLSDGQSNTGPDPLKAAAIAAEHGVKIYTVGVGTSEGATLTVNGWSMRVRLEEEQLKKIAAATGAEYFRAGTATDLSKIYSNLGMKLAFEKRQATEVTALFAALGAALAMGAALLSLLWFSRIL